MSTLIVNIDNNVDEKLIIEHISMLKGINSVKTLDEEATVTVRQKTKTDELLERMEAGEYVSDNEYFASIPGYLESLDEAYEEVMNTPPEKRIRSLGEGWDV